MITVETQFLISLATFAVFCSKSLLLVLGVEFDLSLWLGFNYRWRRRNLVPLRGTSS
jgi:hypothetical protein